MKGTFPRPCAGPAAPQTSRTSQSPGGREKSLYAALGAKSGYPGRGRSPGRGAPRVKRTPPRPCAGLEAPQTSRTSQSARRTSKRLYAALRAKPGYPGRDRRSAGRGWTPRQNTSCEPLCRPGGPGPPRNVPNPPGGPQKACTRLWERNRSTPAGGASSPGRGKASPSLNTDRPAAPDPAEPGGSRATANPGR